MSDSSPRTRRSLLWPIFFTLFFGGPLLWMVMTAHVARGVVVPALTLNWGVAMLLWWAAAPRPGRWFRVAMVVGVLLLVGGAARLALRYEGSSDGTASPSFAWTWTGKDERVLPDARIEVAAEAPTPPGAGPWPRFMGSRGDGVVDSISWSTDWAAQPPREMWRIPVGDGWSGFAVHEGRAFTQEQRGTLECVSCYALASGELLWLREDEARFDEAMGGIGPRATPTLDPSGARLFTLGATGILHCLELMTGEAKWTRQVLKDAESKNITWGKSASPLLIENRVIVSGGKSGPTLLAYDADNGEPLWQAGEDGASYSSPVLLRFDGVEQLVSVNQGSITGHNLTDGQVLWSHPWPGDYPKVSQPQAVGGDRLLVTASYGMKSLLVQVRHEGEAWTTEQVWAASAPRTKFSTPSVVGDHLYAIDEGTLCCVSLADGSRVWRAGRYGYGQHLLCGKDLLLIQTEPGPVVLVQADPGGLKEIARLSALTTKTWNPPTLAGRLLLVRNDQEAICFELPANGE